YCEHFMASNFRARDLAIEAYDSADAKIRAQFDHITDNMTSILTAVGSAMRDAQQDKTRATLAEQATRWVKPLVALAGGIIHGGTDADVETIMAGSPPWLPLSHRNVHNSPSVPPSSGLTGSSSCG